MKISYNRLKEFIEINDPPDVIGDILTQTGLEVEGVEKVEKIPGGLVGIVVGEVRSCEQHPHADKLKVTKVDIGADKLASIVCGAPNVAVGQKVLVATVNATVYPAKGSPFKIKKAKIRGEVSEGMICAEDELGLGTRHDGIMVLDTDQPNGTPAIKLYDTGADFVYEIGLTPNRGDAASHLGVARDLKAYFKREIKMPKGKDIQETSEPAIEVSVENTEACPRYSGVTVKNVKVAKSPDWLQWKLRAIGLEPINNIVDITNYVLHSIGQPMHAFDADEITSGKVIVKTLPNNTRFTTLDEKERVLNSRDLMICDGENEGMCIAGVFGGIQSGVKESTKNIFLESAYFSPDYIRATAQRHTLSTDASFRYERGTNPNITLNALVLATTLILDIAGGQVAGKWVDVYPKKIEDVRIETTFHKFHWLIGKEIPKERIIEILNWLEIKTEHITDAGFIAVVPPYRSEVTREADLVEEVLRIYGFNSIALDEHFSSDYLAEFDENEPSKVQADISNFLVGKGYSEILTNSLTSPSIHKKLKIGGEAVAMLNPSSEELAIMKTTPLYTGLEALAYNINRKSKNLKLFEFSKSYEKTDVYREEEILAIYLTGATFDQYWLDESRSVGFYDLNNTINGLFKFSGIRELKIAKNTKSELFDYELCYERNKKPLGKLGKLKHSIVAAFKLNQEFFYAEINWSHLLDAYKTDLRYTPVPKFPEVKRDLSLVLDKKVTYAEIQELAFRQEKKLLNRMCLFSVYEGEKIENDKKSYAISFFLQDKLKSLADKQIDKCMNSLMTAFEKAFGAKIRK